MSSAICGWAKRPLERRDCTRDLIAGAVALAESHVAQVVSEGLGEGEGEGEAEDVAEARNRLRLIGK